MQLSGIRIVLKVNDSRFKLQNFEDVEVGRLNDSVYLTSLISMALVFTRNKGAYGKNGFSMINETSVCCSIVPVTFESVIRYTFVTLSQADKRCE